MKTQKLTSENELTRELMEILIQNIFWVGVSCLDFLCTHFLHFLFAGLVRMNYYLPKFGLVLFILDWCFWQITSQKDWCCLK